MNQEEKILNLLMEMKTDIDRRFDKIESTLEEHGTRLDKIDKRLDEHSAQLKKLDERSLKSVFFLEVDVPRHFSQLSEDHSIIMEKLSSPSSLKQVHKTDVDIFLLKDEILHLRAEINGLKEAL